MDDQTKIMTDLAAKIVAQNIEKICKSIYKLSKDSISSSKIANGEAFTNYLQSAIEKYSKVKTILYKHTPVNLYDFYVNADIASDDNIITTENVLNILNNDRYILITASGGAGKSTLFKHLFLNTIKETNKIPIFVELKDLNNTENTLKQSIYTTISNLKFNLEQEFFFQALEAGCFVFYFDGFDEIQEAKKNTITKEIIDLSDKYDENYFLVSSRFSDRFIGWHKFIEYKVKPFNKGKAIQLIKKLKYDKTAKDKFLIELENNLYENHSSFASNPLLLTILLMTFDQYAKIPEKIHLFYQQAFETLYSKHDATKGVFSRQMTSNLPIDDFIKVLSTFCALSYIDSKYSFNSDLIIEYLTKVKEIESSNFDITNYKKDLIESVCILFQDGLVYSFTHRSFQEYFTAKFISALSSEDQSRLLKKIFHENSSSINHDIVFDILFDLKQDNIEKNFVMPVLTEIKKLTNAPTPEEQNFRYLKLLYKLVAVEQIALLDAEEDSEYDFENGIIYEINKKGKMYIDFISYICRRYNKNLLDFSLPSYSSRIEVYFDDKEYIEYIKEYGTLGKFHSVNIPFNKVIPKSETFHNILKYSTIQINRFHFCLSLLEDLNKKHVSKELTMEDFFKYRGNKSSRSKSK